jgi:hypothetical protein
MEERRVFQRIPHDGVAEIEAAGRHLKGHIENLSLGGAAITLDESVSMAAGDHARVRIKLCEEVSFEATLRVSWCRDCTVGGSWASIDSDGLAHLKRMLQLNTGDPERAQLELLHWIRSGPGRDRGRERAEQGTTET